MQNSNHFLHQGVPNATNKWAMNLLKECAKAIFEKDSVKIHHILWMLNELASPYGDCEQKVAFYFLQALFYKLTESGKRSYKTLVSAAEKWHSFDSARKVILKFQEVSPWTTFGHVASNSAILEAFEGKSQLHIIDISNTYCTQWPTLLESLATRNDDTPHLKLSVVVTDGARVSVMEEIGFRMRKFARLMGVSFEFKAISTFSRLSDLNADKFEVKEDEAVAVNCIGTFRRLEVEERAEFIQMIQSVQPRVLTVVEEEADFSSNKDEFSKCFEECLKFYSMFFDMLEESFGPTSNERLMLERECSRSILKLLACGEDDGESERREKGIQWCNRLLEAFSPASFSEDAIDDVKALLKRYQAGWSLLPASGDASGLYMTWKQEPVVWASAWKL
uniref:SHORT-ROOT protein-like n=1 Tax=Cymbidium ensifolium TaxID=78740 RepID=A0A3G2CI16_CYMEN|nr:SHORT-ROOT protein-like [Cymbidium ensifolium]